MEIEILKEKELPLLSRKRISCRVRGVKATPSRSDILSELAKKLRIKTDKIIIKHIYSQFGKSEVKLIVHIYDDKEKMKKFEHKNLLLKHKLKADESPAKAPEKKLKEEVKTSQENASM